MREFPPELTLDESEVLCYTENEQNEMEKELTDEISRAWSGMSTRQDQNRKGLKKENRRDNMNTPELVPTPHHGNLQTKSSGIIS